MAHNDIIEKKFINVASTDLFSGHPRLAKLQCAFVNPGVILNFLLFISTQSIFNRDTGGKNKDFIAKNYFDYFCDMTIRLAKEHIFITY